MIERILKILAVTLVAALVVIQFFQIDQTNPPVNAAEMLEASISLPPDINLIISRSCNDCHSHKTLYPWYINVQPAGWFMKDHIDHARSHLNFSVFNTYPPKKKAKKLEEICEQVETQMMPLPSYLWLHRDSVLKEGDAKALCDWANQERERIAL